MPLGIISWEAPSPRRKQGDDLAALAAQLRENPGRWALILEHPADSKAGKQEVSRLFNAIKHGWKGFTRTNTGGSYDAARRTVQAEDGTAKLRLHAVYYAADSGTASR
ncbi:hypothetical protein [Planotetraspora phitsanulokensis]|uniref:Uncharacterized protein n=1 Tax=Planotetraspora phitsanulokensis TaxID=575192 RepID=A0A8J3UDM4_9ACTN|nr:hypothetical protein [Planotetraspora phitsanulokensis]GII42850.1 hypothetical protein Pph01_78530 [Planotetraspora phitsanulokensis]